MTILRNSTVVRHGFTCLLFASIGLAAGTARSAEPGTDASAVVRITELDTNSQKARPAVGSEQRQAASQSVSSSNPWLSFLPVEVEPDYEGWRPILERKQKTRAIELQMHQLAQGVTQFQINQAELEPPNTKGLNDTIGTAEAVAGYGTGAGEDASADISGTLRTPNAPSVVGVAAEDNGAIGIATVTGLIDDSAIVASGTIGDGTFGSSAASPPSAVDVGVENNDSIGTANAFAIVPFETVIEDSTIGDGLHSSGGTGTGDWDFYSFVVNPGRQVVELGVSDIATGFRPILAIYDSSGGLLGVFDDLFNPGSIGLTAEFTATGGPVTFYVAVGGNKDLDGNPSDELPTDPLTPGTAPGFGSEGDYELSVAFVPPGDFDVFAFDAIGGDFITVEVDTDLHSGILDPIVAVVDSTGVIVAFNDDGVGSGVEPFDSFLSFNVPTNGTYYVFVGGFSLFPTTEVSFPSDAFDSSTGPGAGSEGDYDLTISRNTLDIDVYSFDLDAGDIIGMNLTGSAQFPFLLDPLGNNLVGSASSVSGIYPASSPLPGGGVASHAYVVREAGTHYALVFGGAGAYTLELRGFRPPQEATSTLQRLFIDFDGETLDTTIYGPGGSASATLSPLSAFLGNWGLAPTDEDAVIDAILQEVERSLKTDMAANGLNPSFDVEILNSRDHADPFGEANVSRIIVGGTIAESGINTIGIAQSIDPGNFDLSETALVLLDLLSAPASDPNSLNQYPLGGGATRIDVVGVGVGNIVAHEAGHFLANFHTDNANALANIMDTGGNLANLVGVGPDGIYGTGDDVGVFFELDAYDPFEGLLGVEDTKNAIAWSLFEAAPQQTFNDVGPGDFAFSFIEKLFASGITAGCGNGNYCPLDSVTRAQMAVFLERGINGAGFSPPAATGALFNDVSQGTFAASWIEQLANDGITAGCGNGNYCPDGLVSRAQMAVFLLRSKHGAGYSPPSPTGVFNDVPPGSFASGWIEQLAAEGITAGCGNGNYCPNDPVTRAQMAVFLVRTFGL